MDNRYGHLIKPGESFDGPITEQQAAELLEQDLRDAEGAVDDLVKVHLSDNQFAALVDFTYNAGRANFAHSTLLKLLNSGRLNAALDELSKWVYAGGHRLAGLVKRREEERGLFLTEGEG